MLELATTSASDVEMMPAARVIHLPQRACWYSVMPGLNGRMRSAVVGRRGPVVGAHH
ncbi:MAG: hypothetical protein ABR915_12325 [Thermoguttaceae bacterium]